MSANLQPYTFQSSLIVDDITNVDKHGVEWRTATVHDINGLLAARHYLGPIGTGRLIHAGFVDGRPVAAQVWKAPSARHLPADGTWLELARWCLTPDAGPNAGSRQHRQSVRKLRQMLPDVTTLVSYSDPSVGHTGSLYKACNWLWRPTWHRLRPPPSQGGSWDGMKVQAVKDRWVFEVSADCRRADVLSVKDEALRRTLCDECHVEPATTLVGLCQRCAEVPF